MSFLRENTEQSHDHIPSPSSTTAWMTIGKTPRSRSKFSWKDRAHHWMYYSNSSQVSISIYVSWSCSHMAHDDSRQVKTGLSKDDLPSLSILQWTCEHFFFTFTKDCKVCKMSYLCIYLFNVLFIHLNLQYSITESHRQLCAVIIRLVHLNIGRIISICCCLLFIQSICNENWLNSCSWCVFRYTWLSLSLS